jgi:hypothetical protein
MYTMVKRNTRFIIKWDFKLFLAPGMGGFWTLG